MNVCQYSGLAPLLFVVMLLAGCDFRSNRGTQQDAILDKSESYNRCYLEGNLEDARRCLNKNALLLEQSTVLEPIGRAGLLTLTYARLFVLEKKAGNEALAEENLIKLKFWFLRRAELEGGSLDSTVKTMGELTTSDQLITFVDDIDKKHHNGSPASYLTNLNATH